jgi:hypothetical protein
MWKLGLSRLVARIEEIVIFSQSIKRTRWEKLITPEKRARASKVAHSVFKEKRSRLLK